MARVVRRTKVRERNGMKIQFSELIVMIAVVAVIAYAVRYYFVINKASPGYVLGEYLQAVKAGNVEKQYELVSADDKQNFFPTQSTYEKNAKQSRGYTERLTKWSFSNEQTTTGGLVSIDAALSIRDSASGKALYQSGGKDVDDQFVLKKNSSGQWRLVLSKSRNALVQKVPPSVGGDFIGGN